MIDVAVNGVGAVEGMNSEKYDLVLMVSLFFTFVGSLLIWIRVRVGHYHAQTGQYIGDVDDSTVRLYDAYHLHDEQLETEHNLNILFVG